MEKGLLRSPGLALILSGIGFLFGPSALAEESVEIGFSVRNDWRSGFIGEITLINRGSAPLDGWRLEAEFPFSTDGAWGVNTAQQDGRTIFTPQDWNRLLQPGGGRVVFGFSAQPGYPRIPEHVLFNGRKVPLQNWSPQATQPPPGTPLPEPVQLGPAQVDAKGVEWKGKGATVRARITSDWQQAAQLDFAITNQTAGIWRDWQVELAFPYPIQSIWNAKATIPAKDRVIFSSEQDWNRDIAPGETLSFGMIVSPGGVDKWPAMVFAGGMLQPSPEGPDLTLAPPRPPPPPIVPMVDLHPPVPRPVPTPLPPAPPDIPVEFDYRLALAKSLLFYEAQRSGPLPPGNRVPWRGDSALADGADAGVDLTGGYYDAGDHVKFTFPMAGAMTLLAWGGIDYRYAYEKTGELVYLLDAVGWGTDWLLKATAIPGYVCAQVGDANLDHSIWAPPETMTMPRPTFWVDASRPGSDLAAECSAALASASILFAPLDPAYSGTLLERAIELWEFAIAHRGRYSDAVPAVRPFYNSFSGDSDELVWASLWLYRATGEKKFLELAENIFAAEIAGRPLRWTHTWDDKTYGSLVLLAMLTGKETYREALRQWLNYWTTGDRGERIRHTAGGLAWLDPWGALRYASSTAFLALLTADYVEDPDNKYAQFARRQINYLLGDNPSQRSYLIGFGENFPRNPHHRASHGSTSGSIENPPANRFQLTGALVGGPQEPRDDAYEDSRTNFISNEVALDYNAALTGALARLAAGPPPKDATPSRPVEP